MSPSRKDTVNPKRRVTVSIQVERRLSIRDDKPEIVNPKIGRGDDVPPGHDIVVDDRNRDQTR